MKVNMTQAIPNGDAVNYICAQTELRVILKEQPYLHVRVLSLVRKAGLGELLLGLIK
jgi:hypothetical protein